VETGGSPFYVLGSPFVFRFVFRVRVFRFVFRVRVFMQA